MSAKDCGRHGWMRKKIIKRICAGTIIFLFIVLVVVLIVWAVLRPEKPTFILQDISVYAFNISTNPYLLTSNFQVTISSRNPNDNIGIYYDKLDIYAVYRSQQITLRSGVPPTYEGHKEVNTWSPFICGTSVPIAPYLAVALNQDQSVGSVLLTVKVDGQIRWKVGSIVTGHYHLYANCPATITFGTSNNGIVVGNSVKYTLLQNCEVSV
ncbi:Late embryogenesis abundant protein, LEA_2 subgroup [Dillenia turbinata]|uniref:Late embryogenesis abundant protein, LEA_2 subgroup n=1 Tax=Dillenia turbinata TaxID=194707 RepID=A0AAN8W9D4_9MAGN